jgi:hypothetical protein
VRVVNAVFHDLAAVPVAGGRIVAAAPPVTRILSAFERRTFGAAPIGRPAIGASAVRRPG